MKKRLALTPAIALGALGLILTGPSAEASRLAVTPELIRKAHKIEDTAKALKTEFRIHYPHLGNYRHMISDLNEICAQAGHIDKLAHNPRGQVAHLYADVKELDRLAHHLHDLVDASEKCARGHVHGNTAHVHELMRVLNNTIHRLEETIASIRRPAPACGTAPRGHGSGHRGTVHFSRHGRPATTTYAGTHFGGSR